MPYFKVIRFVCSLIALLAPFTFLTVRSAGPVAHLSKRSRVDNGMWCRVQTLHSSITT